MAYLVDALNLIRSVEPLRRALREHGIEEACRRLAVLLGHWIASRPRRTEVVLVLDGVRPVEAGPLPAFRGLTARYMGKGADAELMRRLDAGAGRHVLVSADREIVAVAERNGSDVLAPPAFFRDVVADLDEAAEERARGAPPTPAEVQTWLRLFRGAPGPALDAPGAAGPGPALPPPRPAAPAPPPKRRKKRRRPLATEAPDGGLSKDQVDAWLDYFQGEPEDP